MNRDTNKGIRTYRCEIDYPADCGPNWMNSDNLLLCLRAYCKNTEFELRDILEVPPMVSLGKRTPISDDIGPGDADASGRRMI